jgi:hypothetical protein
MVLARMRIKRNHMKIKYANYNSTSIQALRKTLLEDIEKNIMDNTEITVWIWNN